MKRSRLFKRVLVAVLVLFGTSAVLSALMAAWSLAGVLDREYRSKGMAIALTVAGASIDGLLVTGDVASLQAMVDQYVETEGVSYILVRDAEGEIIVHTFEPEVPTEIRTAPEQGSKSFVRRLTAGETTYIDI